VKVDIIGHDLGRSTALSLLWRLEILRVEDIYAKDIMERGPWVCQQLRELRIYFGFGEMEQDLHQLVLKRLSTLVRLERLIIWRPCSEHKHHAGLEFRLGYGLEHLASLRQLTYFYRNAEKSAVGMEELEWMMDNWKNLKSIRGQLNWDRRVEA
jgi:hypothetical protein